MQIVITIVFLLPNCHEMITLVKVYTITIVIVIFIINFVNSILNNYYCSQIDFFLNLKIIIILLLARTALLYRLTYTITLNI